MGRSGKITIRDIAQACGVTIATVSRAINHQEGMRSEVREHILRYIESVGWRSNSLKNRFPISDPGVGHVLIFCNLWSLNGGGHDSLQNTLALLIKRIEADGIIPMVVYGQTLPALERCKSCRPHAVVLLTGSDAFHSVIAELRQSGVRVAAAYALRNTAEVCPTVFSDARQAAIDALDKFQKVGALHPGILVGMGSIVHPASVADIHSTLGAELAKTFQQLLPDFDPARDVVGDSFGHPEELRRMLKEGRHDCWITCGDSVTQCFCSEAETLGIVIPDDLPVITFGPEPAGYDPLCRLGRFASSSEGIARELYAAISGDAVPEPGEIRLPYRWIPGTVPLRRKRRKTI